MDEGVVLHHSKQKVLGADTIYAKGQSRCWLIDASKLAGPCHWRSKPPRSSAPPTQPSAAAKAKAPALPPNVIPIGVKAA